jgi:O-antigen ligase
VRVLESRTATPAIKGLALIPLLVMAGLALATVPPLTAVYLTGALGAIAVLVVVVTSVGITGLARQMLAVGAFLLPLNGLRLSEAVSFADLALLLAAMVLLSSIFEDSVSERFRPYRHLLLGTGLMIVGAFVGSFFASDIVESNLRLAKLGVASAALPLLIALLRPSVQEISLFVVAFVAGSLVNAVVAFVEPLHSYNQRADGLTTHFNALGLTTVLAIGPVLSWIFYSGSHRRLAGLIAIALLIGALYLSGSRAAALGAFAAVVAAMYLTNHRRAAGAVVLLAGAFVAASLFGLITFSGTNTLGRLFSSSESGASASNADRVELLRQSLVDVFQNPFLGEGLVGARDAHNVYLQIWQSSGILGLFGFALVIYAAVVAPMRLKQRGTGTDPRGHLLQVGIVSGYVGFLVADSFQNALWERYMWLFPALSVATMAASRHAGSTPMASGSVQPTSRSSGI